MRYVTFIRYLKYSYIGLLSLSSAKCRDERPSDEVHTKQNQLFELTKCGSPTCLISQSKIGSLHDEEFEMESIFSILVVLHRPTHFDRERF